MKSWSPQWTMRLAWHHLCAYHLQGMHKQYVRSTFEHEGDPPATMSNMHWYRVFKRGSVVALASVGVRAKTRELLSAGTRLEEYGVFLTPFAMGVVIPSSLPPPTVARKLDNFCNRQILSRAISKHVSQTEGEAPLGSFGIAIVLVCCILLDL